MTNNPKRENDELREISFQKNIMENAYSSVLTQFGKTKILCTASLEERVPPFADESGIGWLSAEYNMLPGSTLTRKSRSTFKPDSRGVEIQRLIGRSLRAAVDLRKIKGYTITIDCDVIQADGGTRTASITGGFVALALAAEKMLKEGLIDENPVVSKIASVSAGKVKGKIILDLDYENDKNAEADVNVVMNDKGNFIEVQGTGEKGDFSQEELLMILDHCRKGISELFSFQEAVIKSEN